MKNYIKLHKNLLLEISLLAAAALSIAVSGINIYYLLFSLIIHELGHIIAALLNGARTENFAVHGFGIEISFPGKSPTPQTLLLISSGGPIASIIVSIFAYYFSLNILFMINISITVINLLPVYPLDGGYIFSGILSYICSRKTTYKIMKNTGQFLGLILSLCGILILYISTFNISLIYIGLFIFFSANHQQNPVIAVTSAEHLAIEKSSVFVLSDNLSVLEAAGSLPVNSIGVVKDKKGKITSIVTPLYLYEKYMKNPELKTLKSI